MEKYVDFPEDYNHICSVKIYGVTYYNLNFDEECPLKLLIYPLESLLMPVICQA
jgi:uncharacterized membrane protein